MPERIGILVGQEQSFPEAFIARVNTHAGIQAEYAKVGGTPENAFGLTDLSGVCHEWCADWFGETYYAESPERNPRGAPSGTRRVSRGGAWRHADPWSAVGHRSSLPPHLRYSDYGVRFARDAE